MKAIERKPQQGENSKTDENTPIHFYIYLFR
jgi:hypothetical protein